MWNQIRHPPYTMPSRDGSPSFIAAGFQTQFGLETQIVAVICKVVRLNYATQREYPRVVSSN